MSDRSFYRLAPFIQEHLYLHKWTELPSLQAQVCQVVFETNAHLLLAANAAVAKLEVAFLPVLTLLHEQQSDTIGVLYIGANQVLIQDKFECLKYLFKVTDIPVWHWQGNAIHSDNKSWLKLKGVLQIAPESLERLLIYNYSQLHQLFADLQFVIIDEVHALMGNECGDRILCQLARLLQFSNQTPRRIGLSASLGDYSAAATWLKAETTRQVIVADVPATRKKLPLAVEHFYLAQDPPNPPYQGGQKEPPNPPYQGGQGGIASQPAIQLEAPHSVSSFLQKLERVGRGSTSTNLRFACLEEVPSGKEFLPEEIPWQLLQAIAIIQLYLEEGWIEPIRPVKYPFSLLYHQIASILAAQGELSPVALASQVLSLPPFQAIPADDFWQLLHYLIDIEQVQTTARGGLIISAAGEKSLNSSEFYAVFSDRDEACIRGELIEISGAIAPLPGTKFMLAGRNWEMINIEPKAKTIWVKPVDDNFASISWHSGSSNIHTKVLQRMRRVLFEDEVYSYLQPGAKDRLKTARQTARIAGLDRFIFMNLSGKTCCIFPWMGSVAYRTLERLLNLFCQPALELKSMSGVCPYYLIIRLGKYTTSELQDLIIYLCQQHLTAQDLVGETEVMKLQKYDEFVPPQLLRKAFASDYLDVEELRCIVNQW
jgi:Lhr-like helicase